MDEIKSILKRRRIELGYSQARLGKMIGKNDAFISRIEQGEGKELSIEMLAKISSVLELELLDVLLEANYITKESLRRLFVFNYTDSEYLTQQDNKYIITYINAIIDMRRKEEKE